MAEVHLREADKLEVTILLDNYTDLLLMQSTELVQRLRTPPPSAPVAEHGLSCLLKVHADSEQHVVLMDAGISATCLFHNVDLLKVDLSQVESVVLSHGHFDHFGGLPELLTRTREGIALALHPDAFLERRLNIPYAGQPTPLPSLDGQALEEAGAVPHKTEEASTLASDLVLVTGEVERVTGFERGFPWAEARIDGDWVVDPFHDDQGVAVKVRGKGLVVIGGCSHAGIINTVKHAQDVARTDVVHAVLGGFHLNGPVFEPIIGRTIEEMKKIGPQYVVPMHCTGWKAINQFAAEMPGQFILNSVGTTYVFQ
ncbi:MAG: MBL fold metallo-hydrolase [Anaerolineae bacterium]|nr:MBL fold metallo-hydrolase [Anaerolineae bacterium]NIN98885.1 MBL fold metallo-hydrolase [Anaerolineae bacterium]NIQ81796.1 MBL fold metallo-hydrolase [Anaerolineae bacterium]